MWSSLITAPPALQHVSGQGRPTYCIRWLLVNKYLVSLLSVQLTTILWETQRSFLMQKCCQFQVLHFTTSTPKCVVSMPFAFLDSCTVRARNAATGATGIPIKNTQRSGNACLCLHLANSRRSTSCMPKAHL